MHSFLVECDIPRMSSLEDRCDASHESSTSEQVRLQSLVHESLADVGVGVKNRAVIFVHQIHFERILNEHFSTQQAPVPCLLLVD